MYFNRAVSLVRTFFFCPWSRLPGPVRPGEVRKEVIAKEKTFFTSMRVERKIAPWLFSWRLDHTKELHETDTSSHLPYKKEIIYARTLLQVLMNNLCGFADRFSGTVWRGYFPILHGKQGFWKVLPHWKVLSYSAWQTRILKSIANLNATHIFHVHAVHLVTALKNLCL